MSMYFAMLSIWILPIVKLISVATITIIIKFLIEYFYLKYQFRNVPSIGGLPFIGAAWELSRIPTEDQQEWFTQAALKFRGNVFITWMGTKPFVNIQKPRHMEALLPSTVNIKKSVIYDMITPWLGNGLLTSTGEKWFHQRRLLTPAFHFQVLEQFTEVMNEKADILNECIKHFVKTNVNESLDVFAFASKFTLDVICETAMGVDMDAQRKPPSVYSAALHEFSYLVMERYVRPWYASDFIYSKTKDGQRFYKAIQTMHNFSMKVIKEKLDKRGKVQTSESKLEDDDEEEFVFVGRRKHKAFLDLLLEASEIDEHPLSIDEIREQVDTFMFAGHDTTATAISWTLFALGNEPEVQERLHEELRDVFADDADKPTTAAELTRLKYLDRVIKETLRLYPSAPFIFRDLCEDVVFDGLKFSKDTSVIINIFDLHRDPEIWENPLEFNPDRFLSENLKDRHPYAYIPFSAGPRNCIGQKFALLELKIALSAILRKWRVKSAKSPKEIKLQSDLVLRGSEPLKLYFTPITIR